MCLYLFVCFLLGRLVAKAKKDFVRLFYELRLLFLAEVEMFVCFIYVCLLVRALFCTWWF